MSGDIAVQVSGVGKKFSRSLNQSIRYGVTDIARDLMGISGQPDKLRTGEFWALEDISFEVRQGEAFALVGSNGAGKSTLLKMLNGILMPDRGEIQIKGRIGALIEVAAGFHPMLSGRENIYVNGAILGLSKKEIDKQLDSIIDFSGIEEFIDTPVKFYSSGMFVRLGFSVAAHLKPDVLLVDEILAVGDMAFQGKCLEHISHLQSAGCSIILVSHNEETVRRACRAGVLLRNGQVAFKGDINSCFTEYHKSPLDGWIGEVLRSGNQKVQVTQIEFLDAQGSPQSTFRVGQAMTLRVHLLAHESVHEPVLDVSFNSVYGYVASSAHSQYTGHSLGDVSGECSVEIHFPKIHLTPGGYRVSVVLSAPDLMEIYDWRRNSWDVTVENNYYIRGAVWMPAEWKMVK